MAVPKSKTSKSRRGSRRSHDGLNPVNYSFDKTSGGLQNQHFVSLDGYYKGRHIIKPKVKKVEKDVQE